MKTTVNLATQVFEFLEDIHKFDYHLKTMDQTSIITYYKDNFTVKFTIDYKANYFNLNVLKEKDNSFTITSVLNKLIYQSENNSLQDFQAAKVKLLPLLPTI